MSMVRRSSVDRMSSSMTSSMTGMGLGGISGLTTGMNSLCMKDPQMTIGGMPTNYVPGLSAYYNISSFCQRPGQTRRWPMQRAGPTAQHRPGRSHSTGALHRMKHSSRNSPNTQYSHNLICKMADQNERRRRLDTMEMLPQSYYSQQPLKVELTEFYSRDNARDHHTEQYDLVNDNVLPNPVYRRGQNFYFAVRFDRTLDKQQDMLKMVFCIGPKPSVTKGTRVVLPVNWSTQQGFFHQSREMGMGMGNMGSGLGMGMGTGMGMGQGMGMGMGTGMGPGMAMGSGMGMGPGMGMGTGMGMGPGMGMGTGMGMGSGLGMGMGMGMSRMQDSSTVMGTMGPMGPLSGMRETTNYGNRRSSFSNEPLPLQHSPLSPHAMGTMPTMGPMDRQMIDRYSGTTQHSNFNRGYGSRHGSRHGSMQNLANIAHDLDRWDISILRQDGNTITFQVRVPATAPVGVWNCWVQTSRFGQRDNRQDYKCDEDIYILFNPWCREDTVFMDNESFRKEYVLNEQGKIWCGTWRQPKGRKWIYGQFDDVVLPAIMYLMERSGLEHSERGNPIRVSRAISSMISAHHDDDGLMVGRYDGEYKDGVAPHAWTGSVAILERYLNDGGRPVEYGQCWVFSGLVVTICRALGIPCRSVTNYVSAHDTNRTFTVDKYFDQDGNEVPNGPDEDCYDSCWNFHVWNDVWMHRPDLPQGYSGWQMIDSTPQEEAESVYFCGPASVEAVRRGEVGFQYDTPVMYCQLNAELCHFQEEENSEWGFIRMASNQYQVGRKVLTKSPNRDDDEGESDMLEITHEYKAVDNSSPERLAVIASCRGYQRLQQYYDYPDRNYEDVFFDLVDIDIVPYGQPFDCTMNIQNKSHEDRTIWCVLTANSCYYTGAIAARLRRIQGEFVIRAGQREVLKLHVTPQEYMDKLVDHSMIKVHAMAYVKQTRQAWSDEDDFPLHKPRMQVQVRNQPCIGQECLVTFSFQNPLSVMLTDCYFTFEGPGVQRPRQIRFRDVKPGEFVNYQEKFMPRRHGERRIVVTFSSRQLDEIFGCTTVSVRG